MQIINMCRILFSFLIIIFSLSANAQKDDGQVYHVKNFVDIPLTAAGIGYSLYGFSIIYGRDEIDPNEIMALDRNNINRFDRPISYNHSEGARMASDKFFYGSMGLPLILLFDKKIRKDAPKIGLMYLEALAATGSVYATAVMIANRYRPYAYNPEVDITTRTRGGAKNSFFAGHVAIVGTSTFFIAKVYTDYHPEMKNKWVLFAVAGAMTATTGFLRLAAGQHFRTDVITGAAVGTLSGIFIPKIHKNKMNEDSKLSFLPYHEGDATGFTAFYQLGK